MHRSSSRLGECPRLRIDSCDGRSVARSVATSSRPHHPLHGSSLRTLIHTFHHNAVSDVLVAKSPCKQRADGRSRVRERQRSTR